MIKSVSFPYTASDEISAKLDVVLSDIDFTPGLAFCFISVDMQLKPLMHEFEKEVSNFSVQAVVVSLCWIVNRK